VPATHNRPESALDRSQHLGELRTFTDEWVCYCWVARNASVFQALDEQSDDAFGSPSETSGRCRISRARELRVLSERDLRYGAGTKGPDRHCRGAETRGVNQ
jgi:hypothetical protein